MLSTELREALHALATKIPVIKLKRIEDTYPSLNVELTVVLREDGKYSKEKNDTDSAQAEEKVICLKCRQEFSSAAYLTYHLKMHERGRVYVCEICDKGFPRKYLFDRHYLKCAWDPMHCATCDRAFFCRQHLIKHCRKCKQQNEK